MLKRASKSRRFHGYAFAIALLISTPARAVVCADPITWLQLCCPKPCVITDPAGFAQTTMTKVLEDLKLASTFQQALAWKEQFDQWGKTLASINGLIKNLMGTKAAGIAAFTPSTAVPAGLTSNPLNISQTAGQIGQIFSQLNSTISGGVEDTKKRQALASDGFLEGLSVALNARTKLDTTAEEIKKLGEVVTKGQSSGASTGKDDESVHSDLAAMNQVRLAMLQALQNTTNVTTAWNSTEGYEALATMGPDKNSAGRTTPLYGSLEQGLAKMQASGVGAKDGAMAERSASSVAFQAYDNQVERAVQLHNSAVAYVSMMKTVSLNQETVAHYEMSTAMANQQRQFISSGLALFYLNASDAFGNMAVQAVGANSMSGLNPYQWGDSFAQQMAAQSGQDTITATALERPETYGATLCEDVEIVEEGVAKKVAKFKGPAPVDTAIKLVHLYTNPQKLTCGALLAKWLSMPAEPVLDVYNDQARAEAYGVDIVPIKSADEDAAKKAIEEFRKDNPNAGMEQAFKYWVNLQKRSIWYYDFACGSTAAADPADQGQCEIYHRDDNPNARAGGAQGVINNLYRAIDDMIATVNDPETTVVLQSPELKDRPPVDITNYASMKGEIEVLLTAADQNRNAVSPGIAAEPVYTNRDYQLQYAVRDIKADTTLTKWVTSAIEIENQPAACGDTGCWGYADTERNEPVTVNGYRYQPGLSSVLPVNAIALDCSQPDEIIYCQPVEAVGSPYPLRPQTAFSPTLLIPPPYTVK